MTPRSLVTPRLVLRPWRDDDAAPLAAMQATPEIGRFLGGPIARAESDAMLARMRAHWDLRGFGVWAIEREGSLVGLTGIMVPRWESKLGPCVEILWRLAPTSWGNGFVTEAARAALSDGFDRQSFAEVLSFTVRENARSWRVMRRLGMTHSPDDDFDHPLVAEGDPLRRHIAYRMTRAAWFAQR